MIITDKKQLENFSSSKRLWQGIPSIEVTAGGRIFITFYSGGTKEEIGNYSVLITSDDGVNFTDVVAAAYRENYRCYDPCLWIDPLGRLWWTWAQCREDGLYAAICEDPDADEIVFGEPFFVGHNVMMNKPTVLSDGSWAFPIAVWNYGVRALGAEYDSDIEPKGSFLYITADEGCSFVRSGGADIKDRGFDEHMVVEMNDGRLRIFARTSYGIGAADSFDGGKTWGDSFDPGYGGPSSRFFIRRLPSGRILLINHYNYTGRNNLTAMLSEDDGVTFPYRLLLDERSQVAYPDAAVTADGAITITYDRERGAFKNSVEEALESAREILTARITEEDILNGKLTDPRSYLRRIASKLTVYDGEDLFG